jgi:hypothetical protein
MAVAEASFLIGKRLGARAEARFLASLAEYDVRSPEPEDWKAIGRLVERYRDLPLGGTDASVIVLADRLRTPLVVTTDRRDFGIARGSTGRPFQLLPEV